MGEKETSPHYEELQSIQEKDPRSEIALRAMRGLKEPYSESYGLLEFESEDSVAGKTLYSIDFDGEAELEFNFRGNQAAVKTIQTLEALSQGIPLHEAVENIYVCGMTKSEELEPVIELDDTLEDRYTEDLSELLEQEFWGEESEELVSRRSARR